MTAAAQHAMRDDELDTLPLVTHDLVCAGRSWQIEAVADQDALLDLSDRFTAFPYGLLLWESALALSDVLADGPGIVGLDVLELGCGVGFSGLAAAHLGARVLQTDHAAEALALARRNAKRNAIGGIGQALADWADWRIEQRFDLVIGADILYDGSAHMAVAAVLDRALEPGGRALLTDPGRTATPFFVRDMTARGWTVHQSCRRIPALPPARAGASVEVNLLAMEKIA